MATKIHCDLCLQEGAKAHQFEKKVELPKPLYGVNTARVHIHVYAHDKRGTMLELCDGCREQLAAAPAYVPPEPKPVEPAAAVPKIDSKKK
jgi:hypothetical protein